VMLTQLALLPFSRSPSRVSPAKPRQRRGHRCHDLERSPPRGSAHDRHQLLYVSSTAHPGSCGVREWRHPVAARTRARYTKLEIPWIGHALP